MATVTICSDFGAQENKFCHYVPIYLPWSDRTSWRRKWQPTPVFLSGESHGQRSLVSHSPWGHKETDMTEATQHACTQDGTVRHELSFWMLSFKPAFSLFSFTFIKRLFTSSLFAIRVMSSAYVKLIFLPAILILTCASSSSAFHIMYSAYS